MYNKYYNINKYSKEEQLKLGLKIKSKYKIIDIICVIQYTSYFILPFLSFTNF